MSNAIEVAGLRKAYGSVVAVDSVDLTVATGEILAFLGPNGAGKTTTIEVLEGYRQRDDGTALVLGVDPGRGGLAWRERLGIVLQESEPISELTAFEAVQMQAGYYSAPLEPERVLAIVGLVESATQRTRKLSGGQRRRLDLAMALVGDPELVFLDEPTTGFDPAARRESWGMISALRDLGKTVLLTTHYMDEAEQLADRIAVIDSGRIVARGTAAELAEAAALPTTISWRATGDGPLPDRVGLTVDGGIASMSSENPVADVHELTGWALAANVDLADLAVKRPTLEDVYLHLVDGGARDRDAGGTRR